MILEEETFEAFGYYPSTLTHGSHKSILAACELCGEFRVLKKQDYHTLCPSCARKGRTATDETKAKMSAARKDKKRKPLTEEWKAKISAANRGKKHTEETKAVISASMKGDKNHFYGKKHTKREKALMSKNHPYQNGNKNPNYNGGRKISRARSQAKREQGLGYILLVPLKDGEDGHHVTNEHVIGIPAEVHKKFSGGSRRRHRTKVLQWLKMHDKKKYKMVLCVLAKHPLRNSSKRRSLNFKNSVQVK
jgi:uncharacterized Zn finger protein (UPF0148 family)